MKHYPITVCECNTQYNPVKNGKIRPCPNKFCPTNVVQPPPVESLPEEVAFDVTNFVPEPEPETEPEPEPEPEAPAKKAAAKKTKGK